MHCCSVITVSRLTVGSKHERTRLTSCNATDLHACEVRDYHTHCVCDKLLYWAEVCSLELSHVPSGSTIS